MSAQDRRDSHERWVLEVRDPAKAAAISRTVKGKGQDRVEWHVAPIPGGWAWKCMWAIGYSGCARPWSGPVPTREDALARVVAALRVDASRTNDEAIRAAEVIQAAIDTITADLTQEALIP